MPLLILLLTLITSAFAAEVTTLENIKTELYVVTTDETLQSNFEKNYLAHACRPRLSMNGTIKEFYFPTACRAEITKAILNSGYRPDQLYRTFSK